MRACIMETISIKDVLLLGRGSTHKAMIEIRNSHTLNRKSIYNVNTLIINNYLFN